MITTYAPEVESVTTAPMNPEIKEQWIARLLDPNAKQGRGLLTSPEGDCCLGVLCKMAVEAGVIESFDDDGFVAYGSGETHVLPWEVSEWAELPQGQPDVSSPLDFSGAAETPYEKGSPVGLAVLNDYALDFKEIAAVIKEQL